MKNEIIKLIAEVLEIDEKEINENTNLIADLDIESLDLVDIVVAFEEKYKIKIADQDIKGLQTVKDIVNYAENNVKDLPSENA